MSSATCGIATRTALSFCPRPAPHRAYATATSVASRGGPGKVVVAVPPRYPATQPPSHKPPEFRKSQLLRQYASLLRASPLLLLFQHNNLTALEWLALRRELTVALRTVDAALDAAPAARHDLAEYIKIHTVQAGIFGAALRVVEYFQPDLPAAVGPSPSAASQRPSEERFTHTLSTAAHEAAVQHRSTHELTPLLSGPLCVLAFPVVSPQHLRQAISILCPCAPDFPPPKKKASPGWHDPAVQSAIQKLILLGARIERKVFDVDGTKSVGLIEGGLDGLQGQLVALLQGLGAQLTSTLESPARSLYFAMEGRRGMMEDQEKDTSPK
ncbi:hypothetical protein K3495_g9044 [Podosphaera aphanis]|nr:hypothetical protein K3495_g9044 [Podosphaera aphanis]